MNSEKIPTIDMAKNKWRNRIQMLIKQIDLQAQFDSNAELNSQCVYTRIT